MLCAPDDSILQEIEEYDRDIEAVSRRFSILLGEFERRQSVQKIDFYAPNARQKEFHDLGKNFQQRAMFGNNRGGKTTCGGAETAFHLTGRYPDWWDGWRFYKPVRWVVMGITAKQVRRSSQRILLGDGSEWGTGMIPKEYLIEGGVRTVHGVSDAVDFAKVQHVNGGISTVYFTSAEQDWTGQQGDELDGFWCDEEPPPNRAMMLYDELVTRTWTTNGRGIVTMTPQRGRTEFVNMFWKEVLEGPQPDRKLLRMEIDECTHLPPEVRERIKREVYDRFPHMADARLRGIPTIGAGVIYAIGDAAITYDASKYDVTKLPGMRFLSAMDVGFANSFTAIVWYAWDPFNKRAYIWDCLQIRQAMPDQVAGSIRARERLVGGTIPMAWPKDAKHQERSTGKRIMQQYRNEGVQMLPTHAAFADMRQDCVEEGIAEVFMAMRRGDLLVSNAPHMGPWWNQKNTYARDEDGKIVKTKNEQFDLMDATRYGYVMLLRGYAQAAKRRMHRESQKPKHYMCLN